MAEFWIRHRRYPSKKAAREAIQAIRDQLSVGEKVEREEDDALLRDLLDLHEHADIKIGSGVSYFALDEPKGGGKVSGFRIFRTDGTDIDFSFKDCLSPRSPRQQVLDALGAEVAGLRTDYFNAREASNTLFSDESQTALHPSNLHVSYFRGPSRDELGTAFVQEAGGWDVIELTPATEDGIARLADRDLADRWLDYHQERAKLGLLTPTENRRRPRRQPPPGG